MASSQNIRFPPPPPLAKPDWVLEAEGCELDDWGRFVVRFRRADFEGKILPEVYRALLEREEVDQDGLVEFFEKKNVQLTGRIEAGHKDKPVMMVDDIRQIDFPVEE